MDFYKITQINNNINLKEYTDGLLFGTDALLLSRFVKGGCNKHCVDLGTGSGVISLLLLSENKASTITGIEIQSKYVSLSTENAVSNGYGDRFTCVEGDVCSPKNLFPSEKADFVVSNPPFMKSNCGKLNDSESKTIARHEEYLPADKLCAAASMYLKYGGKFYVVYRPERMCTLITAMKNNALEPKRIEFVFSGNAASPSLVLIEAKKGASEGVIITNQKI
ncbi:MAG: methyltransferase [Clostridia bacterium]|nr:methyltransferase [Clostridia bacterium]